MVKSKTAGSFNNLFGVYYLFSVWGLGIQQRTKQCPLSQGVYILLMFQTNDTRIKTIKTYITICNIDSQWEFAVWFRKFKQGLCINLDRWDGAGDWREVQKGGDVYTYGWFMLRFDRKQNFVKQLSFNKKTTKKPPKNSSPFTCIPSTTKR